MGKQGAAGQQQGSKKGQEALGVGLEEIRSTQLDPPHGIGAPCMGTAACRRRFRGSVGSALLLLVRTVAPGTSAAVTRGWLTPALCSHGLLLEREAAGVSCPILCPKLRDIAGSLSPEPCCCPCAAQVLCRLWD